MKGNVIVALIVGAALGFVVGKATSSKDKAPVAQVGPAAPSKPSDTPKPPPSGGGEDPNAVYKVPIGNSPTTGPASARVTIVEATDFQCPFCSRANDTVKQILAAYPKDVRLAIKQNPLSFHQFANLAAQAALAAHEQGKYWEMHHKLFENNKALERADLEKYAQELGLNMARFKQALDTQKFKDQIDAEQKLAVSLGAGGTPSFFINGRKVVGAQPLDRFKQVIDEELKKADAVLAKGVKADGVYDEIQKTAATSPVMLPAGNAPSGNNAPAAAPAAAVQKIDVPADAPFKGPKAAKVTIVEWSDFQCPFCSRGATTVHEIIKNYPNEVKFVWRNQPLSFHDHAMPAAKAAMAAARQGKFFEMHDKLFENQKDLTDANFEKWAKELGLNLAKFKADMASPELASQIQKDMADGSKAGADGTPTFFVNGQKVEGAQPFEKFKGIIDAEIKRADALLKSGTKIEQVYDKLIASAPAPTPAADAAPAVKAQVEVGNSPIKGGKNAKVKIFEFSDFQCPFCSRVGPTIKQIEETYGDKVAIVFKNNPLPFHNNAQLAAEAGLAANEQGKFWQMHDKMFGNQQALDRPSLEKYAQEIGLDVAKFKAALDSGKYKDAVSKEMSQGSAAGVSGTPSFVINGKLLVGAQPFDKFKEMIDAELK